MINKEQTHQRSVITSPQSNLETALSSLFPRKDEESAVIRTRRNLGAVASDFSDEQIESINAEFQYLLDQWLDALEKNIFSGKTLVQVLGGSDNGKST